MLYRLDVDTFRAIHLGLHRAWLDPFFAFFSYLGLGWSETALLFAGLLTQTGRRLFWPLATALVVGGLIAVQEIKRLLPRLRPSNLPWAHPQEPIYQGSFPSGHSASAFAFAVTLFLFTRGTRLAWTGWTALGLASLIALSRIYRGVHWPSDVLGGMFCGTFFACLTYLVFEKSIHVAKTTEETAPNQ